MSRLVFDADPTKLPTYIRLVQNDFLALKSRRTVPEFPVPEPTDHEPEPMPMPVPTLTPEPSGSPAPDPTEPSSNDIYDGAIEIALDGQKQRKNQELSPSEFSLLANQAT